MKLIPEVRFVKLLDDIFGNVAEILQHFVVGFERRCVLARDVCFIVYFHCFQNEFLLFRAMLLMDNELILVIAWTT